MFSKEQFNIFALMEQEGQQMLQKAFIVYYLLHTNCTQPENSLTIEFKEVASGINFCSERSDVK